MTDRRASKRARWARRISVAIGVALCAYLLWVMWDRDALMQWVQRAPPIPFFVAMALLPAVGLPMTPLFLLAGASFGLALGMIGTALVLAVNFTLTYWIGRSGLRRHLVSLFARFGWELPAFDVHDEARSTLGTLRFTALVKLAPGVPAFIKSYGLGAARVPFAIYFALSMLFSGAYAAMLMLLGESLIEQELDRAMAPLLAAAAIAGGIWWWSRRSRRRERVPT